MRTKSMVCVAVLIAAIFLCQITRDAFASGGVNHTVKIRNETGYNVRVTVYSYDDSWKAKDIFKGESRTWEWGTKCPNSIEGYMRLDNNTQKICRNRCIKSNEEQEAHCFGDLQCMSSDWKVVVSPTDGSCHFNKE